MASNLPKDAWSLELERKPDFLRAMERIYAWYKGAIIDRVPVRFIAHNSYREREDDGSRWPTLKHRWFDAEYVVESFAAEVELRSWLGETFPVYYPNLGPNVYAAYYGSPLEFEEDTSWAGPIIRDWDDIPRLRLQENEYYRKIAELTSCALERCSGRFMVGYTDLHPGIDCLAAWRDTQPLLMDLYDSPDRVKEAARVAGADFHRIFDDYDRILKEHRQLSVTWMGIPSYGKMHIPSCDFSAMISTEQFTEFCLPGIRDEMRGMTHNVFHVDGSGVANHLDAILELEEVDAIQWVQGVNDEKSIAQWIPLVRKIQERGKSVVLNIEREEIPVLMDALDPEGLLLCMAANTAEEQVEVLKLVSRWT